MPRPKKEKYCVGCLKPVLNPENIKKKGYACEQCRLNGHVFFCGKCGFQKTPDGSTPSRAQCQRCSKEIERFPILIFQFFFLSFYFHFIFFSSSFSFSFDVHLLFLQVLLQFLLHYMFIHFHRLIFCHVEFPRFTRKEPKKQRKASRPTSCSSSSFPLLLSSSSSSSSFPQGPPRVPCSSAMRKTRSIRPRSKPSSPRSWRATSVQSPPSPPRPPAISSEFSTR